MLKKSLNEIVNEIEDELRRIEERVSRGEKWMSKTKSQWLGLSEVRNICPCLERFMVEKKIRKVPKWWVRQILSGYGTVEDNLRRYKSYSGSKLQALFEEELPFSEGGYDDELKDFPSPEDVTPVTGDELIQIGKEIGAFTENPPMGNPMAGPAEVQRYYEACRDRGYDKSYCARVAWSIYCIYKNPAYPGCRKRRWGPPYTAPLSR